MLSIFLLAGAIFTTLSCFISRRSCDNTENTELQPVTLWRHLSHCDDTCHTVTTPVTLWQHLSDCETSSEDFKLVYCIIYYIQYIVSCHPNWTVTERGSSWRTIRLEAGFICYNWQYIMSFMLFFPVPCLFAPKGKKSTRFWDRCRVGWKYTWVQKSTWKLVRTHISTFYTWLNALAWHTLRASF